MLEYICVRAQTDATTGIDIPEMFLLADAICIGLVSCILHLLEADASNPYQDNISDGLVVYPGT